MTNQSKKQSMLEQIIRTAINFVAAMFLYKVFFPGSKGETNILIACYFTFQSLAVGYIIRRFFESMRKA